jgi:hypothetical protein
MEYWRTTNGRGVLCSLEEARHLPASMYLGPLPEDGLPRCPTAMRGDAAWVPSDAIHEAMRSLPLSFRFFARDVIRYTEEGLGVGEIASRTHLDRREVAQVQRAVGSALVSQLNQVAS